MLRGICRGADGTWFTHVDAAHQLTDMGPVSDTMNVERV